MSEVAYKAMAPVYAALVRRGDYTIEMVPIQVRSYVTALLAK